VRRLIAAARRLQGDKGGSIVLLAALSLTLLVGATALALDLTQLYVAKSNVQRIADQSAVAAGFAYFQSTNQTTATNAAQSLATANGIANASTNVTATFVASSPTGDGNNAELITVTSSLPLVPFTRDAFTIPTLTVSASAWGEIESRIPCVETTNGGGMFTTGGITLTATGCNIESASVIDWSLDGGGGTVTANKITAAGLISNFGHTTINGPETSFTTAPADLYATILNNGTLFANLTTVAALSAASAPSIGSAPSGGSSSTCGASNSTSATAKVYAYGTIYGQISTPTASCYVTFSGGTGSTAYLSAASNCNGSNAAAICLTSGTSYTLNIALGAGTYNIAGIYASSGNIVITATGNPTINIWNGITTTSPGTITIDGTATVNVLGGINNSSTTQMAFCVSSCYTQSMTVNVDGGISVSNGSIKFGNGNVTVSSGVGSNKTGAGISVNGSDSITFGDGNFNIANGIYLGGSATANFGHSNGGCSSFSIPSTATSGTSAGYAIYTSGASTLNFSYPCTSNNINGTIYLQGNWYMNANNGSASTWTVAGGVGIGGSASGGNCSSGGSTWTGTLVQIILSGDICIGAGYSNVSLTPQSAITTQTLSTLPTVLIAGKSLNAGGSYFTDGSSITMTGGFYLPYQPLYLTGAGTINGNGGCMVVDVKAISGQSGSSIKTDCTGVVMAVAEAFLVQ